MDYVTHTQMMNFVKLAIKLEILLNMWKKFENFVNQLLEQHKFH